MNFVKTLLRAFTAKEFKALVAAFALFCLAGVVQAAVLVGEHSVFVPVAGGAYREGVAGQPVALNPVISDNAADEDVNALLYANLYDLLSSYNVEEQGRVYILNLKENLAWDDGEPLTSDDVVFTVNSIENPDVRSPLFKDWNGVVAERVSRLQVRLSLPTSYAFFIDNLKRLPVIPKHIYGAIPPANMALSPYNLSPVGDGPYKFDSIAEEKDGFVSAIGLVPNPRYAGTPPYIGRFSFLFYKNGDDLVNAFRMREIDGFGSTDPAGLDALASSHAVATDVPMSRYYAVFMNPNNNPLLKNPNVREALALATPRDRITEDVFHGAATPVASPVLAPAAQSSSTDPWSYDPDKARALLAKAKIGGASFNLVVPQIDFLMQTADELKTAWEAVGLTVNIVPVDPQNALNLVIKTGNYEMLLFGNILENPDDLFPFWHSSERGYPGLNLAFYDDTRADALIEKIRAATDPSSIPPLLGFLAQTIEDDAPAVFLYSVPYTYVHTASLGGFRDQASSTDSIASPAGRFADISDWYVTKARVLQ